MGFHLVHDIFNYIYLKLQSYKKRLPKNSYVEKIGKFVFISTRAKLLKNLYQHRAKLECKLLLENIVQKKILLIYDLKVSPPTYGDLIDFFFLGRLLSTAGAKIQLAIVGGEFRSDWDVLNGEAVDKLQLEFAEIAKFIALDNEINIIGFDEALELSKNEAVYIPFFEQFKTRKIGLYKEYGALSEYLGYKFQSKFSFDKCLLEKTPHPCIKEKYISWHIRVGARWTEWENEIEEDIINNYKIISKYTNLKIVVISSETGCHNIKKYFKKIGVDILVSKDIGCSFLDDVKLVLGSEGYIQMGWGGMFVVAAYSNIPYGICVDKVQETWELQKDSIKKDIKLKPWANQRQLIWKKSTLTNNFLGDLIKTF